MAKAAAAKDANTAREAEGAEAVSRVYEIGYHIVPTIPEDAIEKSVGDIRSRIEAAGGSFIAEGAPVLTRLAFDMPSTEGAKKILHDRAYFGWIKFECSPAAAHALEGALRASPSILRSIVFRTVREETRARIKLATVREVKRTEAIKTTPKREEESAPVSEEDLEKAIKGLTEE